MTNSDRRKWLEILAVIISGALKYVLVDWLGLRVFYITAACLLWVYYILKRRKENKDMLRIWGFRKENFNRVFLFLLPFSLTAIGGILWYGISFHSNFLNWHVIPVLILYPLWGCIQQFLMTALIAGNLKSIKLLNLNSHQAILVTSLLFGLVHYPYLPLMIFAFFMEVLFTFAYFKWRNLWPLGLYHGWLGSLFLFFAMGRDLWVELWKIV